MPRLSVAQMVVRPQDAGTSRITDLMLGGDGILYSTTRYDGQITAWDITGGELLPIADNPYESPVIAGNDPWLAQLTTDDGPVLLAGGGVDGALTRHLLSAGFGSQATLSATFVHPLVQPIPISFGDGLTRVYAGRGTEPGLVRIDLDRAGNVQNTVIVSDNDNLASGDITTLGHAAVDGTLFLYAASSADAGISTWQIGSDGTLLHRSTQRLEDNLRISVPTALESVSVAGVTYLILADAGAGALTVLRPASDGELAIVDYVIDSRTTRFDGVADLAIAQSDGETWIFAGGADDGISAFQILPGGRLIHRTAIADTNESTLSNIAALTAHETSDGIAIYAASATEPGLTRLQLDISADDNIVVDNMTADALTGGAGADLFVLSADGQPDTVTDFSVGEDSLDLSAWNGLRSKSQLSFLSLNDGIQITYGDENLRLISSDGQSIDETDLLEPNLLGATQIRQEITAGISGPVTPPPTLPARYVPPAGAPALPAPIDRIEDYGTAASDSLLGGSGNDLLFGQSADDTIRGADGDDLLFGGPDADRLEGDNGNDQLFGGDGRDTAWMKPANPVGPIQSDNLFGGAGDDLLVGEAGRDYLDGGSGNDRLIGGSGRDTFVFRSGHDVIVDIVPETDRVLIDPTLWFGQRTPSDVIDIFGIRSANTLTLRFNADTTLTFEEVGDPIALVDAIVFL
ncbi:MAG: calcium-binding protein [Pseudomonadota bacterium]